MKTTITKIILLLTFINSAAYTADNLIVPPQNDLIENATDLNLGPVPYTEQNVNFPEATFIFDGGSTGCSNISAAVWYKFTATQSGSVSAFIQTNSNAIVVFYTAPNANVTTASHLTYVDQPSNPCGLNNFATIDAVSGTVYYIYMRNLIVSTVAINVSNAFAAPENDLLIDATQVEINGTTHLYNDIHFLMAESNTDGGQSGCDTEQVAGIWYKFQADAVAEVTASVSSNPAFSIVVFYSAPDGNVELGTALTYIDQPQNACGLQNEATITTEVDSWYYIFVATAEVYANVKVENIFLGVSENSIEGFSYYPNPTSSEINLNAKNSIDEVIIYNLLSQKVYADKPNTSTTNIDVSFLQTGLYVMHITSEGKTASYKIVKN